MDPSNVVNILSRRFEESETIHLQFKHRLQFKTCLLHETVRPKVIYDLTKFLIDNSDLYKEEGVVLSSEWLTHIPEAAEINFASQEDQKVSGLGDSGASEKAEEEDT